ncbi:hypothetical protein EON65_36780 [archaeon]|nr:MAG: hypothetical protein EON65_36780 [archaeon]
MSVNDYRTPAAKDKFDVQQGSSEKSATFIFGNEDHTLGNAIRHILINRPETELCGYSVPHPYEPKMNVRLQTYDVPAIQVRGMWTSSLCIHNMDIVWDYSYCIGCHIVITM